MPFQLHTADAEAKLYQRLDNIEALRKAIVPELAKALANTPAYEGDITAGGDADSFRIVYRKLGTKLPVIIDARFVGPDADGEYVVARKASNGAATVKAIKASRKELIPTITDLLSSANAGESNESALPRIVLHKKSEGAESLTLWQARATDAEAELKKKISEAFKDVKELRTECILHGNSLDTIAAAVLYWKDSRIISFEFSGRSKYTINWYALEGADYSGRVNSLAENPAAELVDENWDDIKDVIETFYIG